LPDRRDQRLAVSRLVCSTDGTPPSLDGADDLAQDRVLGFDNRVSGFRPIAELVISGAKSKPAATQPHSWADKISSH
jgi:hypothetical protein